ncbi:DUF3108 domain-containing protein [Roseateles sp. DB2]|uniref:DUF3108 domain-containing protein n=1 Tax=Roseateles sp. DB2 TaxID=3453717 RepID=UPI003EE8CCC7
MAAGRLKRRTLAAGAALALAVLWLHGLILDRLADEVAGWHELTPMPPRLSAAFVRTLKPTTPPAARPARSQSQSQSQSRPAAAGHAAAAETAEAPASAASAPLPAVAAAASSAMPPDPPAAPASALAAASAVADLTAPAASAAPQPPALGVAAASDSEDFQPGPEWPASTRLDYRLRGNYRGAVTGRARVEWLREGRRYQVHLEVAVGPGFAPLITRTMSSEGVLTPQGIQPERFDEDTRILLAARRRLTLQFLDRELLFPNGRREWAPAGVQDAASQFVQLTWLFLTGRETPRAGHEIRLPLALPRKLYAWRYRVEGEEQLDTPMGPLAAWHLRPLVENTGSDLRAEVWLAPSLQYLPVRLMIRQDDQTWIDLMLQSAPLQAAP